jgi:D-serine deaminase-like pyridoxal phosphate-dependent protein
MVDGTTKGWKATASLDVRDVAKQGWNVLAGDTATPVATLRDSAINHNIEVMRQFCRAAGVAIAPHGKTTMAPQLLRRQLAAGAWGITAANAQQAALMARSGVQRIFIANEIVDPGALDWLNGLLEADPTLEISWYVDSEHGLALAERSAQRRSRRPRLVLELGYERGRTGLRDDAEAMSLAGRVAASTSVELAGVSGYEGTIAADRGTESIERVRAFVERIRDVHARCEAGDLFDSEGGSVVSAGGSMFFDIVADVLAPLASDRTTVLLRSGCYVTHDHGMYGAATPADQPGWTFGRFQPALEVWARVLSRPEPGLVLLDAGRRDMSHDAGLPVPLAWSRPSEPGRRNLADAHVPALSDQHTFVAIPPSSELMVGDLVSLGISHPCTTFDRWSMMMLVDDDDAVLAAVETLL